MTPEEQALVENVRGTVGDPGVESAFERVERLRLGVTYHYDVLHRLEADLEEAERTLVQECRDVLESLHANDPTMKEKTT